MEITGTYNSAASALAAAQNDPPDVIFLDIDMHGMNGLQLREQLPHIPACIFITSYPEYDKSFPFTIFILIAGFFTAFNILVFK